jgi:hypothetical protein
MYTGDGNLEASVSIATQGRKKDVAGTSAAVDSKQATPSCSAQVASAHV